MDKPNPLKLPPPDGGDSSRGPALVIICIVTSVVAAISTIVRLAVRASSRKLGWDDLFIALAILLLIPQTVVTSLAVQAGFGRHAYYLTLAEMSESLRWNYIAEVLLFLIIPFTKISICLFVLRIRSSGWLKWLLYAVIGGLVITTVAPIIVLFAECQPISAFWNKKAGTCWSPVVLNDVNYFQVAYSILSDLVCTSLPIFILWNVQMQMRFKLAICGLMGLGLIATACAIVRMSLFVGDLSADLSWTRSLISIWCSLEEAIGIICANLALSRHIYQWFAEAGWSRKSSSYRIDTSRRQLSAWKPQSGRSFATPTTTTQASHSSEIPLDEQHIHMGFDFDLSSEAMPRAMIDAEYGQPVRIDIHRTRAGQPLNLA